MFSGVLGYAACGVALAERDLGTNRKVISLQGDGATQSVSRSLGKLFIQLRNTWIFGQMAAAFIGWTNSPFQFEVATASLGFAVVGFPAAFKSFDLRLAAIIGPGLFALGAAAGHVYQMVAEHNFAPGNAGVMFYMDIIIPLFGFLLLWLQCCSRRPGSLTKKQ